jgi:hypothetical protein
MNNQQNDRFQEVGSSSSNNPRWEPQKTPLIQGALFPVLDGYFKDLRELVGQKGPFSVAVVTTMNPDGTLGPDVDISGGKTLEDKLNDVPLGTFIRIQYEGKVRSKSSGNDYNNFKVFKDEGAIPFQQLGGNVRVQHQQQNNNANVFNPQQSFQHPPVQQQQFNQQPPVQNGAPVFNSSGQAQQFNPNQQAPVQQFQQQAPAPQQTWTPPAPVPPVQNNGQNFAQQNGGANVFGGNQDGQGLPF